MVSYIFYLSSGLLFWDLTFFPQGTEGMISNCAVSVYMLFAQISLVSWQHWAQITRPIHSQHLAFSYLPKISINDDLNPLIGCRMFHVFRLFQGLGETDPATLRCAAFFWQCWRIPHTLSAVSHLHRTLRQIEQASPPVRMGFSPRRVSSLTFLSAAAMSWRSAPYKGGAIANGLIHKQYWYQSEFMNGRYIWFHLDNVKIREAQFKLIDCC